MCHTNYWIIFLLPSIILLLIGIILLIAINATMLPYSWMGTIQKGWITGIAEKISYSLQIQLKENGPKLVASITNQNTVEKIRPMMEEEVEKFLREKLPAQMPMISMFIGDRTINQLKEIFVSEVEVIFPMLMEKYLSENILNNSKLNDQIKETIEKTLVTRIPQIVKQQSFRFLLILLLAGGVIGLAQVGMSHLLLN